MRIRLVVTLIGLCLAIGCGVDPSAKGQLEKAFDRHESNVPVQGEGVVERILSDDSSGTPHQRIVVRLASGQTVLIQHNTAIAPRVEGLRVGDAIGFAGDYVWNEQGGLVHWTHHDPVGKHGDGWLKHQGHTYQ